jgi:spermidine/putrescine transport system permease protein
MATDAAKASELEQALQAAGPLGPKRKSSKRKKAVPYGLAAPAVLWLSLFFLVPSAYMFTVSLNSGTLGTMEFTWNWSNYTYVLTTYNVQFFRGLYFALATTVLALLIAYPLAYWIAFYGGKRKNVYLLLILLPFFVSFIIRTVQWQFILADNGMILGPLKDLGLIPQNFKILSTATAVIAGMTYNYLPFTALPLYVALEKIDPRLLEAGKDLYATRSTTFRKVVWPLSIPGVFAAFLLTFVPAIGDYVNNQLLGGTSTYAIGQVIQAQFLNFNYPRGAALSFILMLILLIGASIYARVLGTDAVVEAAGR